MTLSFLLQMLSLLFFSATAYTVHTTYLGMTYGKLVTSSSVHSFSLD